MFRDLDEEGERELLRLVPFVDARTYAAGEQLFSQGRAPDRTILILQGHVESRVDDVKARRSEGAVLGRQSLRVGDFEHATVTATTPLETLELTFRDLVRAYQKSDYLRERLEGPLKPDVLVEQLKQMSLFSRLTDRLGELELYHVTQITHEQVLSNGEWLWRQGEIADRWIFVIEGRLRLTSSDQEGMAHEVGELGPGSWAGETGLLVGDFHDVTATADGFARVIYLLRSELSALLRERPYLERRLNVSTAVERRRRTRDFSWLRDDEWVIVAAQRHWTRFFRQAAAPAVILLLLLPAVITLLIIGEGALMLLAVVLAIPALALVGGIIWQYINWRDDYFVVTTQRVVHLERAGPFSTHQEETQLDNIVDIYEVQPGIVANLLNYGNLVLQSAGETVNIDMSYVPDPARLRELISQQVERTRARDVLKTRGQIRELLGRRLDPSDARAGQRAEEEQGDSDEIDSDRSPSPLRAMFTSVWEYVFPPARIEVDGGTTIIWKRYWLPGVSRSLPALIPFVLLTVGGILFLRQWLGETSFLGWLVGWLFIEAIALGALLWFVEDWRNDYFQLTPSHIILVQRLPLLLRESRHEARLDRIQNLGFAVPSIIARVFDFGHVSFETAGTEGKFELQWVRHPERVQKTISNRQYEYRQRQITAEANRRQQELLGWFTTYDELQRGRDTAEAPSSYLS